MIIRVDTGGVPATENEAIRLWCPFARVLLPVHQSGNRIGTFHKTLKHLSDSEREHYDAQERDCNCIASRCMAWRWAGYRKRGDNDEATGYCGLAGVPDESRSAQRSDVPAHRGGAGGGEHHGS